MTASLITNWQSHLTHERRRSVHTVRAYVATAERFCTFLETHNGDAVTPTALAKVDASDIRAFLAHRRGDGLTNASAARELSALRAFLRFSGGPDAVLPALRGQIGRASCRERV